MNKAKEILRKHTKSNGCKLSLQENPFLEQAVINAINEALTIPVVSRSFIIVGWEYNDSWQVCDLYLGEEDEILKTADDFNKATVFDNIKDAEQKLEYLKENFIDYGWYITII